MKHYCKALFISGLLMAIPTVSIGAEEAKIKIERSIPTDYPTKDWVVSDYIVTDFGAKAEPGFDNRAAGIWVGGGDNGGFIRNMQFNPHYGSRLPEGGQGYPSYE